MVEPSVALEAIALCISLGQLASSYLNIWPEVKDSHSSVWQLIKGRHRRLSASSDLPSRTLYCRFMIRVLRVFLNAAILTLKCSKSNPRAVTVITNAATLIESIFEAFQSFWLIEYDGFNPRPLAEVVVLGAMIASKALFVYPYIPKLERFGFLSFGIPVGLDFIFQFTCTRKLCSKAREKIPRRMFLWNGGRCMLILVELAILIPLSIFVTAIRLMAPQILQLTICLTPTMASFKTVWTLWNRFFQPIFSSRGGLRAGETNHGDGSASQTHLTGENAQKIVGSAADSVSRVMERSDTQTSMPDQEGQSDEEFCPPSVPRAVSRKDIGIAA